MKPIECGVPRPGKGLGKVCSILTLVIALSACGKKENSDISAATSAQAIEDPQWVSKENPPNKIAVVFVHGIFGSTLGTWKSDTGTSFFKLLKANVEVGPKVDMYAFGFNSKMFSGGSGSLDVREAANKLGMYLRNDGVLAYPTVVFVGHSMGGLVILRYLASSIGADPDLAAKVPLIALYGAPQTGAQIAELAKVALANPALTSMRPANDNQWLQQLSDDWVSVSNKPQIVCGYEKSPTHGVMIVPWDSSTRFCTKAGIAIDGADHIGLVKPDRPTHPSVTLLTGAIKQTVLEGPQGEGKLEMPDFVPDGDKLRFRMDSSLRSARMRNVGRAGLKYEFVEVSDPALFIAPSMGPEDLPGTSVREVTFALLASATAKTYTVKLQSRPQVDKVIQIDVPDLPHLKQADKRAEVVIAALNEHLSQVELLPIGQQIDEHDTDRLANVAYVAMKNHFPDLGSTALWVLTADTLTASKMGKIAVPALRNAELSHPEIAHTPAVRGVALRAQSQSTEKQIFKQALPIKQFDLQLEKPSKKGLPTLLPASIGVPDIAQDPALTMSALKLAKRFQAIPNLKGTGYALEGEIKVSAGEPVAARDSFKKAYAIEPTPAVQVHIAKP